MDFGGKRLILRITTVIKTYKKRKFKYWTDKVSESPEKARYSEWMRKRLDL